MKNLKVMLFGIITMFVLSLNTNALEVTNGNDLLECLTGTETVCTLNNDVTADSALELKGEKSVKLDLNGKTLTVGGTIHISEGYNLTVAGNGQVVGESGVAKYLFRVLPDGTLNIENGRYTNAYTSGGVIRVIGNHLDSTTTTKVVVGKNATLEGDYGISIYGYNYDNYDSSLGKRGQYAEGIEVDFSGIIDTIHIGVTVNGYVEYSEKDYPVINIKDGAVINSSLGIYAAGYAKWNVGAATLNTVGTGIGIKAGQVYVDGAKVTTTGVNNPEPLKWGDGMNASGSAIQIETNKAYSDNIILEIKSGEFVSEQGYAFLEYVGETTLVKLSIENGTFKSARGLDVFKNTEKLDLTGKISGGTFTSDVTKYKAEGLSVEKNSDGNYVAGYKVNISKYDETMGSIKVVSNVVTAGEKVEIYLQSKEGYKINTLEVLDNNKKTVTLDKGMFTMPKSDVTINGTFEKIEQTVETAQIDTTKEVKEITVGVTDKDITNTLLEALAASDIDTANKDVVVTVDIKNQETKELDEKIVENMNSILTKKYSNAKVAGFFDITLNVLDKNNNNNLGTLTELKKEIKLSVVLPKELQTVKEGYNRVYYIVRNHDGKVDILNTTLAKDGNSIEFETDCFSTYAIAYEDIKIENIDIPKTLDSITSTIVFGSLALISFAGITLYFKKQLEN